ncbi:MAG: hypothetical protein L7V86_13770, partial [Verrucomicrobiales bacterium]|nr:hypothetical protein [Verrucomicrobiales bacterium]
ELYSRPGLDAQLRSSSSPFFTRTTIPAIRSLVLEDKLVFLPVTFQVPLALAEELQPAPPKGSL